MGRFKNRFTLSRRRFAFWVGFGLFNLAERLHADGLDDLAALAMRTTDSAAEPKPEVVTSTTAGVHWTAAENGNWFWFERENLRDGKWVLTGVTTPIHKQTGKRYTEQNGYLDDSLVPEDVRNGRDKERDPEVVAADAIVEADHGKPSPTRRARHGRPPSRWLRSLRAEELRIWLRTIAPPPAGVEGMSYWTHLTRDHWFDAEKIAGLNEEEQALLHSAAHDGY